MSKLDEFSKKKNQLDIIQKEVIDLSFELGMDQDYAELKSKYEETLKYAQEAYEFLKVTKTRIGLFTDNKIDGTTKSYFNEAINQLSKINGLNK